ncbi:hypothetical protein [Saccharibacillus sacchari]|uniref:Uncharacterized protein n=1 Tax=Saccharibacillus sacchari TaxID=456493 RepID=A0ACC6PJF6_9BACL
METKIVGTSAADAEFPSLLKRSRAGDSEALRQVVELLEPDIKELSRQMRMDRSDAEQTLRAEVIGWVLGE